MTTAKMKLVQGNQMKIAICWGRNDTFDSGRCKFIKQDFSGGENQFIFGCWLGFYPIPTVPHKGLG